GSPVSVRLVQQCGWGGSAGMPGVVRLRPLQDPCMAALDPRTLTLIQSRQDAILDAWAAGFARAAQDGRASPLELDAQVRGFWQAFAAALGRADVSGLQGAEWDDTRHFLEDLSRDRVLKGFSAAETATFVFSLKRPLF